MASDRIYVGIGGTVVALDRATGASLWVTDLKGRDFVTILVDGELVHAATRGEVYCLDAATGALRWHNPLKGLGRGLVTIATAQAASSAAPAAEKRRRDQEAAAVATTAAG